MILSMIFITSADTSISIDNPCIWNLASHDTVQFYYGIDTLSTFRNNVIEITYRELDVEINDIGTLTILLQENETYLDREYVSYLVALNRISNQCTWSEYWKTPIVSDTNHPEDMDVLVTNVTLSERVPLSMESRIWRNPHRRPTADTTRPR